MEEWRGLYEAKAIKTQRNKMNDYVAKTQSCVTISNQSRNMRFG
jgi:hypothetical protein